MSMQINSLLDRCDPNVGDSPGWLATVCQAVASSYLKKEKKRRRPAEASEFL
jgi:hypothetical protein